MHNVVGGGGSDVVAVVAVGVNGVVNVVDVVDVVDGVGVGVSMGSGS